VIFFYCYPQISLFPDSQDYIELFEYLKNLNLEGYIGWRTPGYPLFFFLSNGDLYYVVIAQLILGVIGSLFWYKTLLNLKIQKKISFYTTLFIQSLLNVIAYEVSILSESLTLFVLTIIIYMLSENYIQNKSFRKELLIGFCFGYLTLIKPFFVFLPFLVYGFYVLNHFKIKNIMNRRIIIVIFPIIAYFGWSYVNKINTGYFVPTTFFGLNISQNCVRFAEKGPLEYKWISEPYVKYREKSLKENRKLAYSIWYAYHEGAFDKYNLSFADLSNELNKYGMATIKNNLPNYFNQVFLYSFIDFWKPGILWYPSKIKHGKIVLKAIWKVQSYFLLIFRLLFTLITIFYLFLFVTARKADLIMLFAFIVFFVSILQALVTYGSNSRYSFPFEFIMIFVVVKFLVKHEQKIENFLIPS